MKSATRMQSMSMSTTNPNRMVRPMPRTAPRANPVPDPQSGPPPEGGPDVVAGTTIQRDPRDGELWVRAAMFSALEATRRQARPKPVPGCGPPARCRPSAVLRGGRQRLGPCSPRSRPVPWASDSFRVATAARSSSGRDADPAGGGRRLAQPLTVGSDRGGCVAGAAPVDHYCVRARVVEEPKRSTGRSLAPGRASNVRHDTIVVPERMSPAQVRALAERKAQAQVGEDDMVAFLYLHGSRPVGSPRSSGVTATR